MTATLATPLPCIIQGGMGIGISNWRLARAVSLRGQLGVVSGTCIDTLLVRRLQDGDVGGHVRRAMERFPLPDVSAEVLKRYFLPDGRPEGTPYKLLSMWKQTVSRAREQLTVLASFVEVHLAREGHSGLVGLNLLTKVQLPNLATLYGAMLAGVDYVLMGAGIPKEIPGVLDAFAEHRPAAMRFDVEGLARGETRELRFDPTVHWDGAPPAALSRPRFLPIVASNSLATMLARKSNGRVDGFVVEGPTAGGHNAPPRGKLELNERGEPVYGERDEVDLEELRRLGLPFWLAGGTGSPARLRAALDAGAAGIQVGTLFAYAEESGLDPAVRRRVLGMVRRGTVEVHTDPLASPTGFPFKVVQLDGTNSEEAQYRRRERVCDLGYLRTAYQRPDGRIDYRCAAEPVDAYVAKGGAIEETEGRKCLCNALMADAGHAQERAGGPERPLVTSGDDLRLLGGLTWSGAGYSADDVVDFLLGLADVAAGRPAPAAAAAAATSPAPAPARATAADSCPLPAGTRSPAGSSR
ncbi:MAG TPA: nitronate monooxygenase [Longimicrobiales bacterium]|nr:nitronate monooxygenase [Longimicrobiales bacterium]